MYNSQVSREEDSNGMKNVEISGEDSEVEKARQLIEECLNSGGLFFLLMDIKA